MTPRMRQIAKMAAASRAKIAAENTDYIRTGAWTRFSEPPAGALMGRIAYLEEENERLKLKLEDHHESI